jgi:hypothetical protein
MELCAYSNQLFACFALDFLNMMPLCIVSISEGHSENVMK